MKKRIVSLLTAFLLACAAVFAGAEAATADTCDPFCGIWVADGLAVEIWREDEELRCRAIFSDGSGVSDLWEYDVCVYDESEAALQCWGVTRTRERFEALWDTLEELDWSLSDLNSAEFRLSGDALTFTDEEMDAPVTLGRLEKAAPGERTEALAFVGLWKGPSAALRVEDHGACYRFTVTVDVDAETSHRWSYLCRYDSDDGRMTSVSVSPLAVITRGADGSIYEVEEDFFSEGAGFALEDGDRLVWKSPDVGGETRFERLVE